MSSRAEHAEGGHQDLVAVRHFGFWIYLMSDCILFASLFLTYAVLHASYAGGPTGHDVFELRGILLETLCLLASSFTYGLGTLASRQGRRVQLLGWLGLTFVLGAAFVGQEVAEFARLVAEGNGPGRSAFLSAFFTLVATHGLHVTFGLLWMAVLAGQILVKGLTPAAGARVMTLSLFWHFLDIVWICVFTFVYLAGSMT